MSRLAKLTSVTEANKTTSLGELYPKHEEALRKAKLVSKELPTLDEMLKQVEAKKSTKPSLERARQQRSPQTFFCIGACEVWSEKKKQSM